MNELHLPSWEIKALGAKIKKRNRADYKIIEAKFLITDPEAEVIKFFGGSSTTWDKNTISTTIPCRIDCARFSVHGSIESVKYSKGDDRDTLEFRFDADYEPLVWAALGEAALCSQYDATITRDTTAELPFEAAVEDFVDQLRKVGSTMEISIQGGEPVVINGNPGITIEREEER